MAYKDGEVQIVPVDPFHPVTGLLFPFLLKRMLEFAVVHYTKELGNPEFQVRTVASEACLGNPVLLLALLAPDGRLIGHVACIMQGDAGKKWLFVLQCKLDEPGADAISRAIKIGEDYARSHGAASLVFESRRSDSAWAKTYGFKFVRHLMMKSLNGQEPAEAESPKGA